jgi:hypothetical protein
MGSLNGTFIHIPKTGGKTIRTALRHHFIRRCGKHHTALSVLSEYTEMLDHPIIASIRNPWERVWSTYSYTKMLKTHKMSFADWLSNPKVNNWQFRHFDDIAELNRNPLSLESWVCDENGNELVTDYIDFYNIEEGISRLSSKYGVELNYKHIKHSTDGRGSGYKNHYNTETKEYIGKICSWEIEKFKFKF